MYQIKIEYKTGNSFGSNTETDFIPMEWNSIEKAGENLQRIKEHYNFYEETRNWRSKDLKSILLKYSKEDWFNPIWKNYSISKNQAIDLKYLKNYPHDCEKVPDSFEAEHCIFLLSDEGKKVKTSCFWIGYFESLIEASVVLSKGLTFRP